MKRQKPKYLIIEELVNDAYIAIGRASVKSGEVNYERHYDK